MPALSSDCSSEDNFRPQVSAKYRASSRDCSCRIPSTAPTLDEFVDRFVAFLRRYLGIAPHQFQFIENRVLRFLLPVKEEDVLEEWRQIFIWFNALPVVHLRKEFDV